MFAFVLIRIVAVISIVNGQQKTSPNPGPALIDSATKWSTCESDRKQNIYDFQVQQLNGSFSNLQKYNGKVVLIVNVATYCAYTQQYLDFNPLVDRYRDRGFSLVAFPCNQFALQEPAKNHEILNGLRFVRPGNGWTPVNNLDIYGKIDINGENNHPLYEYLKSSCPQTVRSLGKMEDLMYNPVRVDDITWNFEKFLIDRRGRVRYRFHPTAWMNAEVVIPKIEELLSKK